jgi:ketosteroid isomerase-like protein
VGVNAEYLHAWVESWNRGDLDGLIADADPGIEWVVTRQHPDAATHVGVEAVSGYLRDWLNTMPGLRVEIIEIEERGERVFSVLQLSGAGAGSGAQTEVRTVMLSTFRDGKPVRTEEFLDLEEGRRAFAAG